MTIPADGTGRGAVGAFGLLLQTQPKLAAWITEQVQDKRFALEQRSTLKLYDGHYHDLLADFGRERVMADILAWIDARMPPSVAEAGADRPGVRSAA